MRKFRFIGDAKDSWLKPVLNGGIYPNDYFLDNNGTLISESRPKEVWQEVFDSPIPNLEGFLDRMHKDTDLGYFAGLVMQAAFSNHDFSSSGQYDEAFIVEFSIASAKELIKQLDEERNANATR